MKSLHIINCFSSVLLHCSTMYMLKFTNYPLHSPPPKSREGKKWSNRSKFENSWDPKSLFLLASGHGHLCFSTEDFSGKENHTLLFVSYQCHCDS